MDSSARSLDDDECERLTRIFEQLQTEGARTVPAKEFGALHRHMLDTNDPSSGDLSFSSSSPTSPQEPLLLREWLLQCEVFGALSCDAFDARLATFRAQLAARQSSDGLPKRRLSIARMQPISSFRKAPLREGQTQSFYVQAGAGKSAVLAASEARLAGKTGEGSRSFHSFGGAERDDIGGSSGDGGGHSAAYELGAVGKMQISFSDSAAAELGQELVCSLSRRGSAVNAIEGKQFADITRKCSFHLNNTTSAPSSSRSLLEQREAEEDCGDDVAELVDGLEQLQIAGEEPRQGRGSRRASGSGNKRLTRTPNQPSARRNEGMLLKDKEKKRSSFCTVS